MLGPMILHRNVMPKCLSANIASVGPFVRMETNMLSVIPPLVKGSSAFFTFKGFNVCVGDEMPIQSIFHPKLF